MPVYQPMPCFRSFALRPTPVRTIVGFLGLYLAGIAAAADPNSGVNFLKEIAPILTAKCATCHQPGKTKGGYQLHTYNAFMTPGRSKEPPVIPGNPNKSHVFRLLLARDPDDRMPQDDEPLPETQIAVIRRWIEEGARSDGVDPDKPLSSLIAAQGQPAPPAEYARSIPVLALAFHPDGAQIASGAYHEVILWEAASGRPIRRIQNIARQVQQVSFSPDGRYLAIAAGTAGRLGEVKLYDNSSAQLIRTAASASDLMTSVAFSPDGRHLAMAGADNTVSVIEVESGAPVFRTELNADWVMQLAFSPDGRQIASASRDKTVRLLDAKSGELEQTYTGHGSVIFAVAFPRDGKAVISAGRDRSIHVWQESDGKKIGDSGALPAEILRMVVVEDRILSGLSNGEIREFRLNGKRVEFVRKIGKHGDSVGALAAHEPSGRLATAGYDGRIRVWNLKEAALEREFSALPGLIVDKIAVDRK